MLLAITSNYFNNCSEGVLKNNNNDKVVAK